MANKKMSFDAIADQAAYNVSQRVCEEVTWRAKECIAEFYDEYDPVYYNRWGQLEKTVEEVQPKKVSSGKAHVYEQGVVLTCKDMNEVYELDAKSVFELTVGLGLHGVPDFGGAQFPSAVKKMDAFLEELKERLPIYFAEEIGKLAALNR